MGRPGRKEDVLAAAVVLFSRKGYHATTVRDIAEESGMLSGSLYAHIQSKEDLLFEIVMRAADQFMTAVQPIAEGPGRASDKLRNALRAHVAVVAENLDRATVFLQEWKALSPQRRTQAAQRRNDYEALFAVVVQEGIESGEFRSVDGKFARLLIMSAANWLYEWYNPEGVLSPHQVADKFSDLILQGLATWPSL